MKKQDAAMEYMIAGITQMKIIVRATNIQQQNVCIISLLLLHFFVLPL